MNRSMIFVSLFVFLTTSLVVEAGTAGPACNGAGITGQRGGAGPHPTGGVMVGSNDRFGTGITGTVSEQKPNPRPCDCGDRHHHHERSVEYHEPVREIEQRHVVVQPPPPPKKGFFAKIGSLFVPEVTVYQSGPSGSSSSTYTYHSEEVGRGVWVERGSRGDPNVGVGHAYRADASGYVGRSESSETHMGPHGFETNTTREYYGGVEAGFKFRASAKSGLNDPGYAAKRADKDRHQYDPKPERKHKK